MNRAETLLGLAEKYLSEDTLDNCKFNLEEGKLDLVAICLLGRVDGLWQRGEISDEEAKGVYPQLGLDSERVASLRSASKHAGDFSHPTQ